MFDFLKKTKSAFKFKEPEDTACFTCDHVINQQQPILFVSQNTEDGMWQFMCGQANHTEANAKLISLNKLRKLTH